MSGNSRFYTTRLLEDNDPAAVSGLGGNSYCGNSYFYKYNDQAGAIKVEL